MGNRQYEQFVREQWSRRRSPEVIRADGDDALSAAAEQYEKLRQRFIASTGLAGECGEVVELLKKEVRDGREIVPDLALEAGDVLYYLTKILLDHGLDLDIIQQINQAKLMERRLAQKDPERERLMAGEIIHTIRHERAERAAQGRHE